MRGARECCEEKGQSKQSVSLDDTLLIAHECHEHYDTIFKLGDGLHEGVYLNEESCLDGAFVFTDATRETTVHGVVKGAPVHLVSPSFQHITNVNQGKSKVVIRIPFVISTIGKGC